MCIYITVIAKLSDQDLISDILKKAGRCAELIDNPSLRTFMDEDEVQLLTTNKHCDCGTVLGDAPVDEENGTALKTEIKKLKRKKWSQAKIDRYVADREKTKIKKERSRQDLGWDSVEMWADIISTTLNQGASQVGLFYRMYSGSITGEVFKPKKRNVKFRDFKDVDFRTLNENEILYFA